MHSRVCLEAASAGHEMVRVEVTSACTPATVSQVGRGIWWLRYRRRSRVEIGRDTANVLT